MSKRHDRREARMSKQTAGEPAGGYVAVPDAVEEDVSAGLAVEPHDDAFENALPESGSSPRPTGLVCRCGSTNWMVCNTKRYAGRIERRRVCLACKHYIRTVERVVGGGEVMV